MMPITNIVDITYILSSLLLILFLFLCVFLVLLRPLLRKRLGSVYFHNCFFSPDSMFIYLLFNNFQMLYLASFMNNYFKLYNYFHVFFFRLLVIFLLLLLFLDLHHLFLQSLVPRPA